MGNSMDKKVVELEFDNARFNENVKETIKAVKQADDTVAAGEKSSEALSTLASSIKETASSTLSGALATVQSSLSALGNKAHDLFSAMAERFTKTTKIAGISIGAAAAGVGAMIVSGGTKRALNLEHANFQLQGLLKSTEKVKQVMDDVGVSVDGTAYGLDEAAVVASQLAASNVQASEAGGQMLVALRGVAGVAAMGGAEYSRVGQIFTTIAGQGRVMGDQLLQMSSMGLNAASTLKDYYNHIENTSSHTEEEIRDMVSKGKVDFETFAAAMDWAFGEHATKANETFTGALSNVKAALSRIGAEFAIPSLENLRKIFVGLIPVINTFKKAMAPVVDLFKEVTGNLTTSVTDVLGKWATTGKDGKVTLNFLTDMGQKFKIASLYAKAFIDNMAPLAGTAVRKVSEGFSIIGRHVNEAFSDAGDSSILVFTDGVKRLATFLQPAIEYLGQLHNTLMSASFDVIEGAAPGFVRLGELAAPVLKAFGSAFSWAFDPSKLDGFRSWGKGFSDFISALDIPQSFYDNLSNGFTWLFTLFNGIGRLASGAFDGLVEALKGLAEGFVGLGAAPSGPVADIIQLIADSAMSLFSSDLPDRLRNMGTTIGDFFRSIGKNSGDISILKPFEAIGKFFGGVRDAIGNTNLFERFASSSAGLASSFSNGPRASRGVRVIVAGRYFSSLKEFFNALQTFADSVMEKLPSFLEKLKALGTQIRNFLEASGFGIHDVVSIISTAVLAFTGLLSKNLLGNVAKNFIGFVSNLKNIFSPDGEVRGAAVKALTKPLTSIMDDAKTFATSLMAYAKITTIVRIAAAVGLLVAGLWVLSTLKPIDLGKGLLSSILIIGGFLAGLKVIAKSMSALNTGQIISVAGSLMAFAVGILILAAVIRLIGAMNVSTLVTGITAFGVAMLLLTGALKVLSKLTRSVSGAAASVTIIVAAILVLAAVIAVMGHMSIQSIVTSVLFMVVALGTMTAVAIALGGQAGRMLAVAGSVVLLAGVAVILTAVYSILSTLSIEQMVTAMLGLFGCALALSVAMFAMSDANVAASSAAIAIVAAVLLVLAPTILTLSRLPIPALIGMLIALAVILAVAAAAGIAAQPIIPVLAELALVLLAFSAATALIGAGMYVFATTLASIVNAAPTSVMLIANQIALMVSSLLALLPIVATTLIDLAFLVLVTLANSIPLITDSWSSILSTLISTLAGSGPQLAAGGASVVISVLQTVKAYAPNAILVGIAFVLELANSLIATMPETISNAWTMLITGMTLAADYIRSNHDGFYQAGKDLFLSILEAISGALSDFLGGAADAIADAAGYLTGEKDLFADVGKALGLSASASAEQDLGVLRPVGVSAMETAMSKITSACDSLTFDGMSGSIEAGYSTMKLDGKGTMRTASKSYGQKVADFRKSGEYVSKETVSGAESGARLISKEASSKAGVLVSAANSAKSIASSSGSNPGSNLGAGIYSGIDRCIRPIAEKAAAMVKKTKKKTDKTQDAGSPSKFTTSLGSTFGGIFEGTITMALTKVGNISENVVASPTSIFGFTHLLDDTNLTLWDDRPSLKPVLEITGTDLYADSRLANAASIRQVSSIYNERTTPLGKSMPDINVTTDTAADSAAVSLAFEMATLLKARMMISPLTEA